MDDLEYTEFLEYPCRVCGSIEYRYYGGGYNCREGHRNEELREQVADEDDFDFNRSQMRSTQLSQSKMTPQSARVSTKKFRKTSGKGEHDTNKRYGITEAYQSELFEEERNRFQRKGDKKRHVILESSMQILILQIENVKNNFPEFWDNFDEIERTKLKQEFENLARKLFRSYANQLRFPYSHTDTFQPELTELAPAHQPSKYFKRKIVENSFDELDKELLLDDYDYGNESSVSDSDPETESFDKVELGKLLETKINHVNMAPSDTPELYKAKRFPRKTTKPLRNPYNYLNMTFLTHLALIHTGIPVLFSDLARGLELGSIPGYRPDFHLTKDIVTVRFNINEIRAFHTRFLPDTDQLYYDSRLMLEMLARQCRLPDWLLNDQACDTLLLRLMGEMGLPASFFPYIKCHVTKCIGPLNFLILKGDLYLTPCAILAAAILFFLRLLYTLEDQDDIDNDSFDPRVINERLRSQGLPIQSDLVELWKKRIDSKTLFTESEGPVTDPDDYAQLLELANRVLAPTAILNNKSSIKGLFGSDRYDQVLNIKSNRKEDIRMAERTLIQHNMVLPFDNYKHYRSYPDSFNLRCLPEAHQLALRLIQKLVGIRPNDLESVIKRVFETQDPTIIERDRVCNYMKKKGPKVKEKIESNIYVYY